MNLFVTAISYVYILIERLYVFQYDKLNDLNQNWNVLLVNMHKVIVLIHCPVLIKQCHFIPKTVRSVVDLLKLNLCQVLKEVYCVL